jgi:hypothetical protein
VTNTELAEAIKYASERLREVGSAEPQYAKFNFHLEELLIEQRRRAREDERPRDGAK